MSSEARREFLLACTAVFGRSQTGNEVAWWLDRVDNEVSLSLDNAVQDGVAGNVVAW